METQRITRSLPETAVSGIHQCAVYMIERVEDVQSRKSQAKRKGNGGLKNYYRKRRETIIWHKSRGFSIMIIFSRRFRAFARAIINKAEIQPAQIMHVR